MRLNIYFRGSGEDGQLGMGNNEEKDWVCSIKALEPFDVCSIVAGSRNSLAICNDGKVLSTVFSLVVVIVQIIQLVELSLHKDCSFLLYIKYYDLANPYLDLDIVFFLSFFLFQFVSGNEVWIHFL